MHTTEKFVYTYAILMVLFLVFAGFSTVANSKPAPECEWNDCSGPQFGPGPCFPGWMCPLAPVEPPISGLPLGPEEMCLGASGCFPVSYRVDGKFMIAESTLPNGYPTMGWAGPCDLGPISNCPDLGNQAHGDLRLNALRIHRSLRFQQ